MLTRMLDAAKPTAHCILPLFQTAYAVALPRKQKFRGVLESGSTGSLNWTIVRLPFDPAEVWPRRNRLRVRGTISGIAFRSSLFRSTESGYLLLVNKAIQREAGIRPGQIADVVLEPDLEERSVLVPPELQSLLRQNRSLRAWHDRLSESLRRALADRIAQSRSPAARKRRAESTAECMLLAMEGERQLPPILAAAFLRQPAARAGWLAMTPVQRRGHLFGIFYYQSPASPQKRAQKAVDDALRIAARDADASSRCSNC